MTTILHDKLSSQLPPLRDERKRIAKEHGDKIASEVTVAQLLGGLRGVKGLVCDTSLVSPDTGLSIRGVPIAKLTDALPEAIQITEVLAGDMDIGSQRQEYGNGRSSCTDDDRGIRLGY